MFGLLRTVLAARPSAGAKAADPGERTRIAAAVVLLEAAHVDDECTAEELDHVIETLRAQFALSRECAAELVELAHLKKGEASDLWQFTHRINEDFGREEKLAVMEAVWRVIHADGRLDKHEDHLAHKLATLLRLSHKELIDAKIRARSPRGCAS